MKRLMLLGAAALLLVAPGTIGLAEDNDDDLAEERERRVELSELPEPARDAILREADGKEILEVEEITFRGATYYEAEWQVGDMEIEVVVTPKGEVVERETEPIDEEDLNDDD